MPSAEHSRVEPRGTSATAPTMALGGPRPGVGGADQDNLTDSHQLGDGSHLTPLEAAIRAQFKEMLGWLFPDRCDYRLRAKELLTG